MEAQSILRESQSRVPVDTGALRDCGHVASTRTSNGTRVQISFSTEYAVPVHENLDAHHPERQPKFLESVMDERESDVIQAIGKRIDPKRALR